MAVISSRGNALPALTPSLELGVLEPGQNPQSDQEPERAPREANHYETDKERLAGWIEDANLARYLDFAELSKIGNLVIDEYEIDEQSRAEWKQEAEDALKFATQKSDPKQYPWPDASNVIFPLITKAAFQFSALAYPALITDRNIAKGETWGDDDGTPATKTGEPGDAPIIGQDGQPQWLIPPNQKTKRAQKIGEHMSWQLLEQMKEWEPQTDTLLMQMPILGGAVRKTWRDVANKRNRSDLVRMLDLVWDMNAPSFEMAPRHSELITLYPDQITSNERADETFLKIPYGADTEEGDAAGDTLAPKKFVEQHRRYDLDGDGYAEPLIVTVHKQSRQTVRIVARFEESGIKINDKDEIQRVDPVDYYTLYPFMPNPKGGSYPVGFGHLLKPMNEAINTALNQMFDAGHLQNVGGGFIGTSLSIHSGPVNFQLGEYKPVNNKGSSIRDAVFPIPFPGPSPVLFQLLGFLVEAAKDVASLQNILSGDPNLANVQPTTLMALIEQGMRLYTAIYKRVFRSLKSELDKLFRLNRLYIDKEERYKRGDEWLTVTSDDYRLSGGVKPAADPNMVTDMQKMAQALIAVQFKDDPRVDGAEVLRRLFEAARFQKIDAILKPQGPNPKDQAEMAMTQANVGRARAAEVKDYTQGILNLALARKTANEAEMGYFDQMINAYRAHLEALNTTVKAADVDAKFYGHNVRMQQTAGRAGQVADDTGRAIADQRAAQQSAAAGANGDGVSGVAPPPNNSRLPALSGPPGGQLPAGPSAAMGVG